jgi:hypothetical protein
MFLRVGYLHLLYFHAVLNNALFSGTCSVLYRLKIRYGNIALSEDITDRRVFPVACESSCCFKGVFKFSVVLVKNMSKVGVLFEMYRKR